MALLLAATLALASPEGVPPEPTPPNAQEVPSPVATPAPPAPAAVPPAPEAPPAKAAAGPSDPLEPVNRLFYAVNQPFDRFLIRPVAQIYLAVLPEPVRDGAHNAIHNLLAPVGVVNDVLQLRPRRALRATVRILINTTLGVGGLFDMAKRKPFNIPGHDNGFADTLGYYGIKAGPYLYLPLLGPTTARDVVGAAGDYFTQPRVLGFITHPSTKKSVFTNKLKLGTYGTVITIVNGLDERARADDDLERIRKQSVDPYASLRAYYLQNRAGEIAKLKAKDGEEPHLPEGEDPLADPLLDPAAPEPAAPPSAAPQPAPAPAR